MACRYCLEHAGQDNNFACNCLLGEYTLKDGFLRFNRFLGRGTDDASPVIQQVSAGIEGATCPKCGSSLEGSRRCPACNTFFVSLPRWAQSGRDRRFFTRRRLITAGVIVAVLLFVLWLNYPFLPNYRILLFNRPTSDITSNSTSNRWSMDGGDIAQRKVIRADFGGGPLPTGQIKWSFPTGEGTRSGPVVADGKVFLGAYFKILALDSETGEVIWSRPESGPVQGTPALANGTLYAGYLDHRLRAIDAETGDTVWEFKAEDIITASPLVHNGTVYFGAWDRKQYALDAVTGAVIWTYDSTEKIGALSPIDDEIMAVADKGGRIHLLNARTGQNRLVYRTPKSALAAPVIAHDHVYFAAGGRLYAIDATEKEVPGQYQFKRVWAQFWLWQVPGVPRPAGQQGGKWRFSPDGPESSIVASPAVSNTHLFVGDLDGRLYSVDPLTGVEQWRFQAEGPIYASPVVAGSTVYVATRNGTLYSVDANSGQAQWELTLSEGVTEPIAFAEGKLFVRTTDGTVHAIE